MELLGDGTAGAHLDLLNGAVKLRNALADMISDFADGFFQDDLIERHQSKSRVISFNPDSISSRYFSDKLGNVKHWKGF